MEKEVDISRSLRVPPHKLLIPRRSLVLVVPREHTLQAHTYALNIVYRAPALLIQKIQAYYAVRVDVRMDGDMMFGVFDEDDFGSFDGVGVAEFEL